jgi:Big-like domain-containing protein
LTVSIDAGRVATIMIPTTDWNGSETITFRAADPGLLFDTDVATFTVTGENDTPVVANIPNQTIAEGASFAAIDLDSHVTDVDDPDADITWTYSGNSELTVSIDANRVATITTPAADWNGSETITFRATDLGLLFDEDTVTLTVSTANDAPQIVGQEPLTVQKNETFTIAFEQLTILDVDNVYPDDFTMQLYSGENYSLSGNTVSLDNGFTGELYIPVSVNDGLADSNIIDFKVTVSGGNNSDGNSSLCFISTLN